MRTYAQKKQRWLRALNHHLGPVCPRLPHIKLSLYFESSQPVSGPYHQEPRQRPSSLPSIPSKWLLIQIASRSFLRYHPQHVTQPAVGSIKAKQTPPRRKQTVQLQDQPISSSTSQLWLSSVNLFQSVCFVNNFLSTSTSYLSVLSTWHTFPNTILPIHTNHLTFKLKINFLSQALFQINQKSKTQ